MNVSMFNNTLSDFPLLSLCLSYTHTCKYSSHTYSALPSQPESDIIGYWVVWREHKSLFDHLACFQRAQHKKERWETSEWFIASYFPRSDLSAFTVFHFKCISFHNIHIMLFSLLNYCGMVLEIYLRSPKCESMFLGRHCQILFYTFLRIELQVLHSCFEEGGSGFWHNGSLERRSRENGFYCRRFASFLVERSMMHWQWFHITRAQLYWCEDGEAGWCAAGWLTEQEQKKVVGGAHNWCTQMYKQLLWHVSSRCHKDTHK